MMSLRKATRITVGRGFAAWVRVKPLMTCTACADSDLSRFSSQAINLEASPDHLRCLMVGMVV